MKINKFILKIYHFFGLQKDKEHISDIIVNINISLLTENEQDDILFNNKESIERVEIFKDIILTEFKNNPKLEQRCQNVNQVWLTFYQNPSYTNGGSIMKVIYYDEGVLFHPQLDKIAYERHQKLKSII